MLMCGHSCLPKKAAAPAVQTDRERRLFFDPAESPRFAPHASRDGDPRTIQDR